MIILRDNYLFQGCDILPPKLLIEDSFLELNQVLIIHQSVAVLVTNAENSSQRLDIIGLQFTLYWVIERCNWKQYCFLCGCYNIYEIYVDLGWALNAHLNLLELLEVTIEQIRVLILICLCWPQVHFVAYKNHGHFVSNFIYSWHPVRPQALNAVKLVDIIDKNDHICLLNLAIRVLLILTLRARINQLRVHLVRQQIVIWRDRHWMILLLNLPREIIRYQRHNYRRLPDTLYLKSKRSIKSPKKAAKKDEK